MKTGGLASGPYDAVLLLVPHKEYLFDIGKLIKSLKPGGVFYDLKSLLNEEEFSQKGFTYVAL
jgi:hypothetical protein